MARASEFFVDNAPTSFTPTIIAPSDRHPIQLAEPIFLSNYRVIHKENTLNLSWGDEGNLEIATERISSLSELNAEAIDKSTQIFGLLRFNSGHWSVQPLAATVRGKTIYTGKNAAKILRTSPKTSIVGTLQERASRLLRKG